MLHPLFTLLIRKPELVIEHLAGYGALVNEEVSELASQVIARAVAWGAMAVSGLLFLVFTGVAIMVGCANEHFHWALVVVPGVMLAATVGCFLFARSAAPGKRFEGLKAQIEADVQAMRIAGESK